MKRRHSSHNWYNCAWMRRWLWEAEQQRQREMARKQRQLARAISRYWLSETARWN